MEISMPEGNKQGNQTVPTLLMWLEMNATSLPLLERMTMSNMLDPQPQVAMGITWQTVGMTQGMKTTRNQPSKKSPLTSWTTLSKFSGAKKSANSRPYQTSSPFLTSTHPGLNEQRIWQSNTTPGLLMKSKPSLLQRLSKDNMPSEDSNLTCRLSTPEMNKAMLLLMNSYHNSARSQEGKRDRVHETLLTTMNPVLLTLMTTEYSPTRNAEYSNPKCHGSWERKKQGELVVKNAKNHEEPSHYSPVTTKLSNNGFKPLEQRLLVSQAQNGTMSSEDKPSTLMLCSHHCTMYPPLKRTLDAWDQLKFPLAELNQQGKSKRVASGPAPGMLPSKQLNSLSLTMNKSLGNMGTTSRGISLQESHPHIEKSFCTTQQSEMKSGEDKMLCSPTPTVLPGFILQSSCQMESNQNTPSSHLSDSPENQVWKLSSATNSTLQTDAETQLMIVGSDMHANAVSKWLMEKSLATLRRDLARELHPKYLWHNVWDGNDHFSKSSADWSETAKPLPSIPESKLANPTATKTISENPRLFEIVTPIYVNRFENLLQSHPNQPFVKSVCWGLCEGFWPWAYSHIGEYPDTLDLSYPEPDNPDEVQFLWDQRDHKVFKGQFSEPFGDELLPGMYCMPVFAIPKPHSTDLQMVTHQSTGKYSLNSMIPRDDVIGYPLDNLHHLGEFLLSMHRHDPNLPQILFKSNVPEAYRLLPVHPYWQIKQVNCIGGSFHIDRNSVFGGQQDTCLDATGFLSCCSSHGLRRRNTISNS